MTRLGCHDGQDVVQGEKREEEMLDLTFTFSHLRGGKSLGLVLIWLDSEGLQG